MNVSSDNISMISVMGDAPSSAAARGRMLEPNLVAGARMCEYVFDSCAFFTDAEMVSANESALFVLITDVTEEGRLEGSMDVAERSVMGPECSFWAAVIAERVEGARVVESAVGSAMTRVDALRDTDTNVRLDCILMVFMLDIIVLLLFQRQLLTTGTLMFGLF